MNGTIPSARRLLGRQLIDGWEVVEERFADQIGTTGGHFSAGYIVRNRKGRLAFLKALDFSPALSTAAPILTIKALADAYVYERELLARCGDRRMDRVVKALGSGEVRVDQTLDGLVYYLIFELADGDVRMYMRQQSAFDLAWALRTLHQIGVGVQQLHVGGIAHQDLKPSNVFMFAEEGSKIGDLGSACAQGVSSPKETLPHTGDLRYAPPEILYGYVAVEWDKRRFGCDLYLFGSLITFVMAGVNAAPALQGNLAPEHRRRAWGGTWPDLLPFLQQGFGRFLSDLDRSLPPPVRSELGQMVRALCEPDPNYRGHPKNRKSKGNRYGVERFISELNLLAYRAEVGNLRSQ